MELRVHVACGGDDGSVIWARADTDDVRLNEAVRVTAKWHSVRFGVLNGVGRFGIAAHWGRSVRGG